MRPGRTKYLLAVLLGAASQNHASEPGTSVVVVYNRKIAESKNVAEYYARRRDVPDRQVIGFDLPASETMTRWEFTTRLQKPLLNALEEKGLLTFGVSTNQGATHNGTSNSQRVIDARIRYVALCYGVPLKILKDPDLVEDNSEKFRPELRRNEAAVDSELAELPLFYQKPMLTGPMTNPLYAATNPAAFNPTNGILLVARLDGPSVSIARGLVDKALEAETNGLWGRAYLDARGITSTNHPQGGYFLGDEWMRNTAIICRRLGFETVQDDSPDTFPVSFPMSQIAVYAGWYDDHVSGPFTRPNVEFMPGAIAYHLHSFSATTIRSKTSHWVGPLLDKGATATLGYVEEPYLGGTIDVPVFFSRLIGLGFSFGEAAYAAQSLLSWQTAVVGDPLYRPFGRRPQDQHEELERRKSPLVEWSQLRIVNLNLALSYPADEVIAYLERLPLARQSAVLKEKLGELYLAKKKLSDAMSDFEAALRLNPTPQQKIRLILALTRLQTAYGRDQAAYRWYQTFLKDFPDYPDLLTIYQKIVPLAQEVGTKEEVEKYQQELRKLAPASAPGKS